MGSRWIREVWQPFRDRIAFAGLVDLNPAALHMVGDRFGLPAGWAGQATGDEK
jgi:hypothetical protein